MSAKRTVESYRAAGYLGWARRREREDRVLQHIPVELHALWEAVGDTIAPDASPHARFEAFIKYVEEHEGEAVLAMQASADAKLERMIAAYQAAE
jgi:hypothetical protein